MLTGWVCLYLFLVYVLTHGGKIQGWHAAVWVVATFLGMWIVASGQRRQDGGQISEDGGQNTKGSGDLSSGLRSPASGLWDQIRVSGTLTFLALILPLAFSWILSHFTDFSWDGMTSRGVTVRNLMKGDPTLNAYPFGHVLAGFLSHITGSWQGGKGINLTLIWICFCFVFPALRSLNFSGWKLWFLSSVTALNPVAVYQISCFQIDGHVASLITCLLFSMMRILAMGPVNPDGVLALVASFAASATCKFSGAFYAMIINGIFLILLTGISRNYKRVLLLFVLTMAVSIPIEVYIRGAGKFIPPNLEYLKTVTGVGPGYGYGGGASEVAEIQRMNRFEQFALSAFSRTEISVTDFHLKPPFELGRRELRVFEELTPDPRAGGFGPWFGTAFLFAGVGCLLLVFQGQITYWPGWFLFLATAASSIGSQVWWARWTPQNWLLLIAMVMTVLAFESRSFGVEGSRGTRDEKLRGLGVEGLRALGVRVFGGIACLAIGVNVILVTLYYLVGMGRQEKVLNCQIEFAARLQTPVPIYIPVMRGGHAPGFSFLASKWWFVDRGIPIIELPEEPSRPRMKILKTETRFPLPQDWRFRLKDPEDEALLKKRGLIED